MQFAEFPRGFPIGGNVASPPVDCSEHVPEDYLAGFPWHPHRGIETTTYVLAGTVEHGDSMGNNGTIGAGDVQWITAGSGIIHQEMPKGDHAGRMHGFQLWGNLPSTLKMTSPRYQEVKSADIPEIVDDDGTHVKIVSGNFWGKSGPVDGVAADPIYLTYRFPPASGRLCRWRRHGMLSLMCLRATGNSATRRGRWRFQPTR
jgi:redox-sensitive bicupin YhaK (pirin superfamily)